MKDRHSFGWIALCVSFALIACAKKAASPPVMGFGGGGQTANTGIAPIGTSGGQGGSGGVAPSGQGGSGGAGEQGAGTSKMCGASAPSMNVFPPGTPEWQKYDDTTPATLGTVDRGKYLVDHVLVCGICHTPALPNGDPDPSKYLAGSRPYNFTDTDGTVITVNAENLTSHDPEGLCAWRDGQIRTALTKGVDDEHYALYPIMPYPEYSLLTPEDVDSIIKYLRSVPPNDNVVASDFPHADVNPPATVVDGSKIPHTTLMSSDPNYAAAERGRYLASVACLNCHTEEAVLPSGKVDHDVPDLTKAFAGGKHYAFDNKAPEHTSANITPDPTTGIATWAVADIVAAIKTSKEKDTGRVFCNTHPGTPERLGQMTDADAMDIAIYIHTLPPVKNGPFKCIQ